MKTPFKEMALVLDHMKTITIVWKESVKIYVSAVHFGS